MRTKVKTGGSGIGFFGLLTILFIGLKLTGHVDWSWWWVLAPVWMPFAVVILGVLVWMVVDIIRERQGWR